MTTIQDLAHWRDTLNGAELKILDTIPATVEVPLQFFLEKTGMARTEIYERMNALVYKGLVYKEIHKGGFIIFGITDLGIQMLEKWRQREDDKRTV